MTAAASPSMRLTDVPEHVPPDLVREFDFKKNLPDDIDSYREFSKLHDGPDVFYTLCQGGHWVVTRFDDIEAVFSDAAAFSSRNALIPKGARPMHILPLESDPPIQVDYRAILRPYFTPKVVGQLENQVKELTRALIKEIYPKGKCEFMSEFAQKLPIGIFMRMVNLPDSDVPLLLQYCKGFFHGETPEEQMEGTQKMVGYVAQKVQERSQNLGDDILSAVITGTVENGRPMTQEEILGMSTVLLFGGLDTVASMFGWIAKFLAENPGHRKQLVDDPALINNALEEIMRRHHIGCLAREIKNDIEYKGVSMKAGDMILLPTIIAGLDTKQFSDPFTVDFNRSNVKHLVFGRGPHMCIGSALGRMELRAFMAEWLKMIPDFRIQPGSRMGYITGITHAVEELHLEWDVE